MDDLPIAVTLGEPAGIGPEITVKAKKIFKDINPFFVIGNYEYLSRVAKKYFVQTQQIFEPHETYLYLDKLCVINQDIPQPVVPGVISYENSSTIPESIRKAVSFVQNKKASALVTNPINKWALKQSANFKYEGHTDFLASLDKPNI